MKVKIHLHRNVFLLLALLIGCKKDKGDTPEITMPEVTTSVISIVTRATAASGGNITSDGGADITAGSMLEHQP